jgi:hypothetical protein
MSAEYGGINEQHAGANGQRLPESVNGTFSLKGGRRRNSKRQSRRQRKQRKSRKQSRRQRRQKQSKGQKGGK